MLIVPITIPGKVDNVKHFVAWCVSLVTYDKASTVPMSDNITMPIITVV